MMAHRDRIRLPGASLRCLGLLLGFLAVQAQAGVSVEGGRLLRDGRPWTPHGIVQIAFVAEPSARRGVFADAYRHYSPDDYRAMQRYGIDSVRIQASQPGLDPTDPKTAPFRAEVIAAVRAARAAGLVVMLSIQDEKQSGETHVAALPDGVTRAIWQVLAPEFMDDTGVMYELLNEPNLPPSPAHWRRWGKEMDATLAVVRQSGARNVAVADGLLYAERLGGAPELRDRTGQLAYASHPYAHHQPDQAEPAWEAKFGAFARTHPVIVTEWATVTVANYYCDLGTPRSAEAFLHYLDQRHIGLMAYGWDFSGAKFGSTFHGFPPQPTAYRGLRCGDPGFGPGRAVERLYLGTARAPG